MSEYRIIQIIPADRDHHVLMVNHKYHVKFDKVAYIALCGKYNVDGNLIETKVIPFAQTEYDLDEDLFNDYSYKLFRAANDLQVKQLANSMYGDSTCWDCKAPWEKDEDDDDEPKMPFSAIASWEINHGYNCKVCPSTPPTGLLP